MKAAPPKTLPFEVKETDHHAVEVRVKFPRRKDWEWWSLLLSDVHWDNPKCRRDLLTKHLNQAEERQAAIFDFGDFHCAMQGKYDRRRSMEGIRPEHANENYLGSLTTTAAEYLAPYAPQIVLLGEGNHETSIRDRCGYALTAQLAGALRPHGFRGQAGNYAGWCRFRFHAINDAYSTSVDLWYTHGYGGGGPVTQDTIQAQRQAASHTADITVSGHTHDRWATERVKLYLDKYGKPQRSEVLQIKTGTYKDAIGTGGSSWEQQKGHAPKPLGGMWLRFSYDPSSARIVTQAMPAK